MSPIGAAILDCIAQYPLSLVELIEDLNLDEWEEDDLVEALRELIASGQVRRLESRDRDEQPFFARSLHDEKPGD